jgi:ribosome-interacting GTPase 1
MPTNLPPDYFEIENPATCLPISAYRRRNLDRLERMMVASLDIIRVYAKTPGREPDLTHPFVFKRGSTAEELAGRIHK